jgi:hypothetical protein
LLELSRRIVGNTCTLVVSGFLLHMYFGKYSIPAFLVPFFLSTTPVWYSLLIVPGLAPAVIGGLMFVHLLRVTPGPVVERGVQA